MSRFKVVIARGLLVRLVTCLAVLSLLMLPSGCRSVNKVSRRPTSGRSAVQRPLSDAVARTTQKSSVDAARQTGEGKIFRTSFDVDEPVEAGAVEGKESLPKPPESAEMALNDVLNFALTNNPDLQAVRATDMAKAAAARAAEQYPFNPSLQSQYQPRAIKPAERTIASYYILVLTRIELCHQQRYREEIARQNWSQAHWNVLQSELTVLAAAQRQYFTALYQHDLLELAHRTVQMNERLKGIVERRYELGLSTVADVTTTEVSLTQSRRQEKLAAANYQTALRALRQTCGMDPFVPLELNGSLTEIEWLPLDALPVASSAAPDIEGLATNLAPSRPDVLAAEAAAHSGRAAEQLARANKVPLVETGPIYTADDFGNQFLGGKVQWDLPVVNSGEALRRQRHAEWHSLIETADATRRRALLEAGAALERYIIARQMVLESQSGFTEEIPPALVRITSQFESGQASILDVYVIQNALLQDRRTYLDLLNEAAQASADVVQATALPPPSLIAMRKVPSSEETSDE